MSNLIMWVAIGVLALFLVIGLVAGLIRGLKRSSLHFLFLIVSVVISFFITKPITTAVLGMEIPIDGQTMTISEYIISMIQTNFDISKFETATDFINKLPNAIVAPILFIILTLIVFLVFDIIYLIVARLSFGKKKSDFEKNKPYRAYGGVIGMLEGFLFLFVLFAPITSLTKTYQQITEISPSTETSITAFADGDGTSQNSKLQTVGQALANIVPAEVSQGIIDYNNSVIGKIAGAGGLDNALFDHLSNFEIKGEKIEVRKEIVSTVEIYDDFTVIYNDFIDQNNDAIDFTSLKNSLENFLNNGFFKTVVSDTINDIVLKFDEIKADLNLTNLPTIVQDIINDLHTQFAVEGFDTYEYLKHDILNLVDTAELIFENNLLDEYNNLANAQNLTEALEVINKNSQYIKDISKEILSLNLVRDTFETLGSYASEMLSEQFAEQNVNVVLNTNLQDKEKAINDLIESIEDVLKLNEKINITELLEGNNFIDYILSINDLDEALSMLGTTLDKIRNLEILVLPAEGESTQPTYVFDNILEGFDFKILGDEVYVNISDENKTTIDSYTDFINFIKEPLLLAQQLGVELTNIDTEQLVKNLANELESNPKGLSKLLLPLYQIKSMNINESFDQIMDIFDSLQLADQTKIFNIEKVRAEATKQGAQKDGLVVWDEELTQIGELISALNQTSSEGTQTYIDMMLFESVDIETVFNDMLKTGALSDLLEPVFSAFCFEDLSQSIFQTIDTSIGDTTKITPDLPTDLNTKLKDEATRTQTISVITSIFSTITEAEQTEISLQQIGKILDILKTNAYNEGSKDGIFNNVFVNLIWYMTGDNLSGNSVYDAVPTNENYKEVKAYLNLTGDQYYTYSSYENAMIELETVVNVATSLSNTISGATLDSVEDIQNLVKSVKDILDAEKKTDEEKEALINDMKRIVDTNPDKYTLLTEQQKTYQDSIVLEIDDLFGADNIVGTALKNLLGIGS